MKLDQLAMYSALAECSKRPWMSIELSRKLRHTAIKKTSINIIDPKDEEVNPMDMINTVVDLVKGIDSLEYECLLGSCDPITGEFDPLQVLVILAHNEKMQYLLIVYDPLDLDNRDIMLDLEEKTKQELSESIKPAKKSTK